MFDNLKVSWVWVFFTGFLTISGWISGFALSTGLARQEYRLLDQKIADKEQRIKRVETLLDDVEILKGKDLVRDYEFRKIEEFFKSEAKQDRLIMDKLKKHSEILNRRTNEWFYGDE